MVAPVGHALRSACIYELGHTQRCLGSGEKAPVREVRERSTVHRALAVLASLFWLGFAWFVLGSVAALMGEGGRFLGLINLVAAGSPAKNRRGVTGNGGWLSEKERAAKMGIAAGRA